jgi:hypothetical protein
MPPTSIPFNFVALGVLGIAFAAVLWSLAQRDKKSTSRINLEDLLLDPDGRMSKAAAVMFGSFLVTTWMMVYLTLSEKMSEGYLTIYGGLWVAPTVAIILKSRATTGNQTPPEQP